jgi:hypothetical protein
MRAVYASAERLTRLAISGIQKNPKIDTASAIVIDPMISRSKPLR